MVDTTSSTNNLSLSLPTDFLGGSGGLNLNFNFGGNADAIASSAYSFVNAGLSNANAFLGNQIQQTQSFVASQSQPVTSAVSKITTNMGNILPSLFQNLFQTAGTAMTTESNIASASLGAEQAISQASISASQSNANSGGCFITTAVCETLSLPDDCDTLNVLRAFRDSYMQATPERRALVTLYYSLAPAYVAAINRRDDAARIYARMLTSFIEPALLAITQGDDADAFALYCALVEYARHSASGVRA